MGLSDSLHMDRQTVSARAPSYLLSSLRRGEPYPTHALITCFVYTRYAHYPPHRHSGLTTHLILSGEFTVCYPEDDPNKKETFGPGARIDVPANKSHEVWMGKDGCKYVIGE